MMLIDLLFSDRIVDKYTAFGVYHLMESSLVFFKQEQVRKPVFETSRALLLKLFLSWKNYNQSGQKISLNWNLLNQTILKTVRLESRQIVQRISNSVTEKKESFQILNSLGILNMQYHTEAQDVKNLTWEHIMYWMGRMSQSELNKVEKELLKLKGAEDVQAEMQFLFGTFRNLNRHSMELSAEHVHSLAESAVLEWLTNHTDQEKISISKIYKNYLKTVSGQEFDRGFTKMAGYDSKHVSLVEQKELRRYLDQFFSKYSLNFLEILTKREIEESERFAPGTEIQNYQQQLLSKEVQEYLKQLSGSEIRNYIEQFLKTEIQSQKPKISGLQIQNNNDFEDYLAQIGQQKYGEWAGSITAEKEIYQLLCLRLFLKEGMLERGVLDGNQPKSLFEEATGEITQISKLPVIRFKMKQMLANVKMSLSQTGQRESSLEILHIFRRYEKMVFQTIRKERKLDDPYGSKELQLFYTIATILTHRSLQPDRAKKAEKELVKILLHDLYLKNEDKTKNVEKKKKIASAVEQSIRTLSQNTRSREVLRAAILGSNEEQQIKFQKWTEKYSEYAGGYEQKQIQPDKKEQMQMISQIRSILGEDAAQELEHYFKDRSKVTGQSFYDQTETLKEEKLNEIQKSYLSIMEKEQMIQQLRPQGYVQLTNLVREKVHIPMEAGVQQHTYMHPILQAISKNYNFSGIYKKNAGRIWKMVSQNALLEFYSRTMAENTSLLETHSISKHRMEPQNGLQHKPVYRTSAALPEKIRERELGYQEQEFQVLKKQRYQEEELTKTKNLLETFKERMDLQEKTIRELKKTEISNWKDPNFNITRIADEVVKKMEQELHLERLRRGLW